MTSGPQSRVEVGVTSLRRLRLSWSAVRWTIVGIGLIGALGAIRGQLISKPTRYVATGEHLIDRAAEAYATAFARAYLTWDAARPSAHAAALAAFVGQGLDPDAGLLIPSHGRDSVMWTEIAQARRGDTGARVYSVAAVTREHGLVYLSIGVRRRRGQLQIDGYPAFVGAPQSIPAVAPDDGDARPVQDSAVREVVRRTMANYLADQADDLRADLAPGANVAMPGLGLRMTQLDDLGWAPGGGAVEATVDAKSSRGPAYTLRYELDLTWRAGRPLVQAIQMNPTT